MCKICIRICNVIEEVFGHKVDPADLGDLIESSPATYTTVYDPQWGIPIWETQVDSTQTLVMFQKEV